MANHNNLSTTSLGTATSLFLGYDGRAHPVPLVWLTFCFLCLWTQVNCVYIFLLIQIRCVVLNFLQVHLTLSYLRSKHPLRLLLIDLVNLDFVRLVFLLGCVYLLCYFLVHSGILVPDTLAALLAVLSPLLGKLVLLYLAASSMIQYLHLKWRTASPFEVILDEHMSAGIRLLIALVAVGVTAVRLKNDPNLLENLLDPSRATYSTISFKHSSDVTYYTLGSLLGLTASATVVFRLLAHRQKREILKVVAKYQVAKEDLELKLEEGRRRLCRTVRYPSYPRRW